MTTAEAEQWAEDNYSSLIDGLYDEPYDSLSEEIENAPYSEITEGKYSEAQIEKRLEKDSARWRVEQSIRNHGKRNTSDGQMKVFENYLDKVEDGKRPEVTLTLVESFKKIRQKNEQVRQKTSGKLVSLRSQIRISEEFGNDYADTYSRNGSDTDRRKAEQYFSDAENKKDKFERLKSEYESKYGGWNG